MLGEPSHQKMVKHLQDLAKALPTPKQIIIFSAHWEENTVGITAGSQPGLIYDYYGFPDEAYSIQYPAAGNPALASALNQCFNQADVASQLHHRGFDHGVFVPLTIMYPHADIPCVQVSLHHNLDAADHIKMGKALQNMDLSDTLVIGSGFSCHNMKAFFTNAIDAESMNREFQAWLKAVLISDEQSEDVRQSQLINWEKAPNARFCHPREEHLLPLHVCYGLAGRSADEIYQVPIVDRLSTTALWHGI